MQLDPSDGGVFAVLGLKLVNVVVGAVSSFVALKFFDGLKIYDKWLTFVGGWAVSAWGAGPLAEFLELSNRMEIGIVLLLGLFGMAVAAELIRLGRSLNLDLVRDFFGRK